MEPEPEEEQQEQPVGFIIAVLHRDRRGLGHEWCMRVSTPAISLSWTLIFKIPQGFGSPYFTKSSTDVFYNTQNWIGCCTRCYWVTSKIACQPGHTEFPNCYLVGEFHFYNGDFINI